MNKFSIPSFLLRSNRSGGQAEPTHTSHREASAGLISLAPATEPEPKNTSHPEAPAGSIGLAHATEVQGGNVDSMDLDQQKKSSPWTESDQASFERCLNVAKNRVKGKFKPTYSTNLEAEDHIQEILNAANFVYHKIGSLGRSQLKRRFRRALRMHLVDVKAIQILKHAHLSTPAQTTADNASPKTQTPVENDLQDSTTLETELQYSTALENELQYSTALENELQYSTALESELQYSTALESELQDSTGLGPALISPGTPVVKTSESQIVVEIPSVKSKSFQRLEATKSGPRKILGSKLGFVSVHLVDGVMKEVISLDGLIDSRQMIALAGLSTETDHWKDVRSGHYGPTVNTMGRNSSRFIKPRNALRLAHQLDLDLDLEALIVACRKFNRLQPLIDFRCLLCGETCRDRTDIMRHARDLCRYNPLICACGGAIDRPDAYDLHLMDCQMHQMLKNINALP